jgi:hypothetical protein
MRRLIAIGGAVVALVLVGGLVVSATTAPRIKASVTIHVIEHATTDVVIDTGAAGDTTGDLLTFANKVYDKADDTLVGRDQGDCIRIDPAKGSWECRWVTFLGGGSVTVEGPFFDSRDSTLAVTGGTGRFRNARGQMLLHALNGGTEYDFIFQLEP